MFSSLTEEERAERDALVDDVYGAFAGVTRGKNGISWKECVALDDYETAEVCQNVRRSDTDRDWRLLVDDAKWCPFPGVGGFSFINAEGFRYYLPPTMVRFLRGDITEWYPGHLLGNIERFTEPEPLKLYSKGQLSVIARFIAFMGRHDESSVYFPQDPNLWMEAIERRWHAYLPK